MNVYGTPVPVVEFHAAAVAAGLSEDDLMQALRTNGKRPVKVSATKLGVRPADLNQISVGAANGLTVYYAAASDQYVKDDWPWQQPGFAPTLTISGTPVTTGQDGVAYTGFTVTADGGDQPYTYSLVGTWPAGLTVNATSGAVSGTPTEDGAFASLSVRVTDDQGSTANLTPFTLTISPA